MKNNVVVLIPAYQPNKNLISYVDELSRKENIKIIIIDDGSSKDCNVIFDTLSKNYIVLRNKENHGKGYSVKKGFQYILDNHLKCDGVITVDADLQHKMKDVINIISAFKVKQDNVIFGVRNFNLPQVPIHRKWANKLTRFLCKIRYHKTVSDTQTGLRLYSGKILEQLLTIDGERYEYEFAVLIYLLQKEISITEIGIETIYYEENISHFHAIKDSFRIYRLFFRKRGN